MLRVLAVIDSWAMPRATTDRLVDIFSQNCFYELLFIYLFFSIERNCTKKNIKQISSVFSNLIKVVFKYPTNVFFFCCHF
jgi:hypothetical protein